MSSAEAQLRPVAPLERVALLDVLRGFALLGVLIVNVRSAFSSGWFRPDPSLTSVDTAAALLIRVFFVGKAMTLLTFLFGLGFAMQLARAEARGQDIRRTYVRRLLVLFGLGLCHLMLWWGDVLSHYALIGFVLLACRRAQPRALLAWAAFLVLVPQLVMAWPGVMEAVRTALGQAPSPDAIREVVVAAVRGPDFGAMEAAHFHQLASYLAMIVGWYPAWVLGRFLLGYYVGVRRLFDADGAAHLPLFRRVLAWGIALGVISNAVELFLHSSRFEGRYELTTPGLLASFAVTEVALLATAAAYVGLAVLLLQRPAWRRVLLIVAPAGRMGLTVYLGQTVIATAVFYGWGLGLGGKLGTAGDLALSVAIFSLEVALAHLWLRRFRFGPVEWLWRTLAYGKRQPMRIGSAPAAGAGAPAAD